MCDVIPGSGAKISRHRQMLFSMDWPCRSNFYQWFATSTCSVWTYPLQVPLLVSYRIEFSKIWFKSTQIHVFTNGVYIDMLQLLTHIFYLMILPPGPCMKSDSPITVRAYLYPSLNHHVWHHYLTKYLTLRDFVKACNATGLLFDRVLVLL